MMGRIKYNFTLLLFSFASGAFGQVSDSLRTSRLGEVVIEGEKLFSIERLPRIQGTYLWSGKKNEVINVGALDANVTDKTARQIFSKVPGVFVYDMDGTGNQINISTRGLDPHRGWEFNVRKNGIITNSDMYGYPASHYSMPIEAVGRIELVRGTASLQYGAQFGGMLNYVSKKPDTTRSISYEGIHSVGSFNTLSTFHAVGGAVGKFKYYAYYHKRGADGYRYNSRSDSDAQSLMVSYSPGKHFEIKAEVARSQYTHQIAGPLTDSMFNANPRHATRARNYYSPDIVVPSLSLYWQVGQQTRISWVTSAVLGVRSSVQFTGPANVADDIDPVTLQYDPRFVDIDHYNSYTSEFRVLHEYRLGRRSGVLTGGVQLMRNRQHRQQLGEGTRGTDYDLSVTGDWGRDLWFKTSNIALFAENTFSITPSLTITPGVRVEVGETDMSGTISYYDPGKIPTAIEHRFPLFGVNAEYTTRSGNSIYAGWSQSFRPVIFQDVIPATPYDISDEYLKDATGYNLDIGYRGSVHDLRWDVSAFTLLYRNRPGTLAGDATQDGNYYILRTTIGDAVTSGAEIFAEYPVIKFQQGVLSVFTSTAFFRSEYKNASLRSGNENVSIDGNRVESVPDVITRNGVSLRYKDASLSILYSYTGETFADPANTEKPSPSGSVGIVPSYGILDINASVRVHSRLVVRLNLSNVTDRKYFTKRPEFYPGPGIWTSDGRAINCSVGIRL